MQAVTVITGVVVGLTFMFGFGNVLNLALRLDVPTWVAPLVAPAVDLSILGLLLGTWHQALAGASVDLLRPARRLLIFASVVNLALNVADPLVAGDYGKAAFDAVGPLLLIGWAEVGPDGSAAGADRHRSVGGSDARGGEAGASSVHRRAVPDRTGGAGVVQACEARCPGSRPAEQPGVFRLVDDDLLQRARDEDARHWEAHRRPISADTLRQKLRIGAGRSRLLVAVIRTDSPGRSALAEIAAVPEWDVR